MSIGIARKTVHLTFVEAIGRWKDKMVMDDSEDLIVLDVHAP